MIAFLPTVTSLLLTLLIAWPAPIILVLVAQRIDANTAGNTFAHALARACGVCGILWGIIETLRMSAQIDGVGEAHFDWGRKVTRSVRRFAHLLALTYLPLAFISHFCEALEDEVVSGSIGRLAFIARMAAITWAFSRLLNSASPIMQTVAGSNPVSLFRRTSWLWPHVLIYSPLVLILISASGYHYTAIQLFVRFTVTILAAFSLFLLSELVSRWLLISYRRLAIQRAREQRIQQQQQQQQAAAAAEGGALERPAPAPVSMGLNLTDINAQARQIIRIGGSILTVAALYLIWVDVLPALGILDNVQVWPNTLIAAGEETQVVGVTASDLLLAGIIAVLTLVASRNVPGLMEMMFLSRLPLDAGARYAATTVSRYVILVTGFIIGFRQMGIGWSSVQWLVAAMSVGLGFGLQEIFANFVSGIILLFERPIRVGDTITIGEFSGNVARIRIRATTIIDWDQKDVIIPNRELVTGKLVNWTLSNASLRIIIPVGIAYGSDTRLATELLRRVADEHPAILTDPEPQVIFSSFGDNSLLFELRVYVSGLSLVLSAKHELHMAIDDLFRKHQIEISFPQRDLHVRSVPQELITAVQRAARDNSDSDRDAA